MSNDFFKYGNKVYAENLNDGILVGNAFDWTLDVDLPVDTGGVFPNSSTVGKAKVADVSIVPNSNLSIGSTIENSSGSSQVYRLTVYPNFNRFGGFVSISLVADSGVTFYIANKGASTPIANNLDYDDLSNVPELKVLKEYDIVVTIPSGKEVEELSFVLQSSTADVNGIISQSNVNGLTDDLDDIDDALALKADKTDLIGVLHNELVLGFTASSGNMKLETYSSTPFVFTDDELIVDWGDGNTEYYTSGKLSHTYSATGNYVIRIKGNITILNDCFYSCTGLTSVVIPNSVTSLGDNCFYSCTGLTSVVIPNSVTSLDDNCFYSCTGLTSVVIPDSVTVIGAQCFKSCTGLTSIKFEPTIPASVYSSAFNNVPSSCRILVPIKSISVYKRGNGYPNPSIYTYIGYSDTYLDKWETIASETHYTLQVEKTTKRARIIVTFDNVSTPSGNSNHEVNSFVPTEYLPKANIIATLSRTNSFNFYCWASNGTVGISNNTGSATTLTCDVQIDYTY